MSGADPLPRIQADTALAMKAGDKERVRVLRTVASELKKAAIDGGVAAVDGEAAIAVLRKAVKARVEAADQAEKVGRPEIAARERAEVAVIEAYLPKALGEAEVRAVVEAVVRETGAAGPAAMGGVVKASLARLAGAADGKTVARIAGEVLKRP